MGHDTKESFSEIQVVTFKVEEETYAVSVSNVKEIILPVDTFPVPGMKDPVKGVINLRGEIVPVLEIHSILGLPGCDKENQQNKKRFMILDSEDSVVGFEVDQVMEVVKFKEDIIKQSPYIGKRTVKEDVLLGIIHSKREIIIVIDPVKLVSSCMDMDELARSI
ncbi:MAG TPA: chemotaxis protein CheW [Candidatus Krumholzibacteriaceae bacterium]|nr:chemotaxis protein CheW [Candidatus Krumholzibacteriaceae bacterium]